MKDVTENALYVILFILFVFSGYMIYRTITMEAYLWRKIHALQTTPDYIPAPQDMVEPICLIACVNPDCRRALNKQNLGDNATCYVCGFPQPNYKLADILDQEAAAAEAEAKRLKKENIY